MRRLLFIPLWLLAFATAWADVAPPELRDERPFAGGMGVSLIALFAIVAVGLGVVAFFFLRSRQQPGA